MDRARDPALIRNAFLFTLIFSDNKLAAGHEGTASHNQPDALGLPDSTLYCDNIVASSTSA